MRALRRAETVALVALGLLLVVAVGDDMIRRADRIHSFHADARVLNRYVHHHAHRPVFRPRFFRYPTHDTACANAGFDGPVRVCLQLRRVGDDVRAVGGWRAPSPPAEPGPRFGCFGLARRRHYCHRSAGRRDEAAGRRPAQPQTRSAS